MERADIVRIGAKTKIFTIYPRRCHGNQDFEKNTKSDINPNPSQDKEHPEHPKTQESQGKNGIRDGVRGRGGIFGRDCHVDDAQSVHNLCTILHNAHFLHILAGKVMKTVHIFCTFSSHSPCNARSLHILCTFLTQLRPCRGGTCHRRCCGGAR